MYFSGMNLLLTKLIHAYSVPSAPEVSQQVDEQSAIELLNSTTVGIHWSPPDEPNGVILGYQVIYFGYTPPETPASQVQMYL